MAHVRPSDLELQVLTLLWQRGPSSVHDLRQVLPDGKERAYTTVLTVMQNMEKKNLVGHTQQGQANIYHALAERRRGRRPRRGCSPIFSAAARPRLCNVCSTARRSMTKNWPDTQSACRGSAKEKGRGRPMTFYLDLFSSPAWQRLLVTLAHSLWQGLAIATVLRWALAGIPTSRTGVRYFSALGALMALSWGFCFVTWALLDLNLSSSPLAAWRTPALTAPFTHDSSMNQSSLPSVEALHSSGPTSPNRQLLPRTTNEPSGPPIGTRYGWRALRAVLAHMAWLVTGVEANARSCDQGRGRRRAAGQAAKQARNSSDRENH